MLNYVLEGRGTLQWDCSHVKCSDRSLFILPITKVLLDPGHKTQYKSVSDKESANGLPSTLWHGRLISREHEKRKLRAREKVSASHEQGHQ